MSRIGRLPIPVPAGVDVKIDGSSVTVKGPKGSLTHAVVEPIAVAQEGTELKVTRPDDDRDSRARHGLTRTLINNMVVGVTDGFTKQLEIIGVGYRATAKGKDLNLSLGYSHPVVFKAPEGITITTPTQTEIVVAGADKQLVGEVAAKIRGYRPPEPYKGKGVKYSDETIIRKEAKKA